MKVKITAEELKRLLHYNEKSGEFVWKIVGTPNQVKIGDVAGYTTLDGYIDITINRATYRAHVLAWLYTYGVFPENELDHINHIRLDNRIENLRSVTHSENHKNLSIQKNNKYGIPGIDWYKSLKKWRVRIKVNGEEKHLGLFTDLNEAKKVRERAKIKYGFHPNHA